MNDVDRWLEYAADDIRMAELALAHEIFRQVCFHSHQAVEKALKGLLLARLGTSPRGHSLEELLLRHPATHGQLAGYRDQVRALDAFYIPTRYPDAMPGMLPEGEPQRRDAESALQNAESILAAIRAALEDRS